MSLLASHLLDLLLGTFVLFLLSIFIYLNRIHTKLTARSESNLLRQVSSLSSSSRPKRPLVLGIFHPFCNAGGGGERVLWKAVEYMQRVHGEKVICVIYTGDWPEVEKEEILKGAMKHFNISLSPSTIIFVPLPSRHLIGDTFWKRFTLLGQAFGSLIVGWQALVGKQGIVPDIFVDTMGYAFTYPIVKFFGGWTVPIGAYIHYPTISTDMLSRVQNRQATHTNTAVAGSFLRSFVKLQYYRIFATLYTSSLSLATVKMTNSTWTKTHIDTLLSRARSSSSKAPVPEVSIVYPPCDTGALGELEIGEEGKRERVVLSLAQFRPEKDHAAQLRSLKEMFDLRPNWRNPDDNNSKDRVRLVMIGSARDSSDEARVESLKQLAKELGILENVSFVVNAPYPVLLEWLGKASVGISTMVDEHFGINVVEFMAAGLLPLSHASAGPLLDIILPFDSQPTGFHARTPPEFASALVHIFELPAEERKAMRLRARKSVEVRFGTEAFEEGWRRGFEGLRLIRENALGERAKVEREWRREKERGL